MQDKGRSPLDRTATRSAGARVTLPLLAPAVATLFLALQGLAGAAPQVFKTPTGRAENVRVERAAGEVITVAYDLVSDDSKAIFVVALRVSRDGGKTFDLEPKSVSGDVGSGVRAGAGKKIVWQAGRDVESVEMELFRFSVRLEAANARPVAAAREPKPGGARPAAAAPKPGSLEVKSTPAGAAVEVDGQPRGVTPVTLKDIAAGEHRVTIRRDGYLENARTVAVAAGKTARVAADLTPAPKPAGTTATAEAPKKGSPLKWLLPVAGGAGAVGILAASKGKSGGSSPGGGTPPPTYLDSVTITTLTPASGATINSGSTSIVPSSGLINVGLQLSSSKERPAAYLAVYLLTDNQSRTACGFNSPDYKRWQNMAAGQLSVNVGGFQLDYRSFPCAVTGVLAIFTTNGVLPMAPPAAGASDTIAEALRAVSYRIQ